LRWPAGIVIRTESLSLVKIKVDRKSHVEEGGTLVVQFFPDVVYRAYIGATLIYDSVIVRGAVPSDSVESLELESVLYFEALIVD
jgi:hypothetical protein